MWSPPQGAETKVVDSHREAAVVITAQQSGLPLAALHPLALWKRQSHRRPRKVRKRKLFDSHQEQPSSHYVRFQPKRARLDSPRNGGYSWIACKTGKICVLATGCDQRPVGLMAVTNHSLAQKNRSKLSR